MAKTPKAIGKNGDLSLTDITASVLEWTTEAPRYTSKLSDFLFTLPDDFDASTLVPLADDAAPLPKLLLLAHAALRSDDAAIAEKLKAAFDAYEIPAITTRGIDKNSVLVAAMLTARALKKHGLDAADKVDTLANERLDQHVDLGFRIPPVFRLLAALGELDVALKLLDRRQIPWEESSKKVDNTVYYYQSPHSEILHILATALLKAGRHDDVKALVEKSSHSWSSFIHHTIDALATEDPREMFAPLLDVDVVDVPTETLRRRVASAILSADLPDRDGRKNYPLQENMDHPLLEEMSAQMRLAYGDVTGFREHFAPHDGVIYTALNYRAKNLSTDAALKETREHLANSSVYASHAGETITMFHEALDRENLDDAQKFMALLDEIFTDVDNAQSLSQYDRNHIDAVFCRYTAAKCRLLFQQGQAKDAEKLLKAATKRAKAGGERAVKTLVHADLSYNLPHLAVGAAMKLPLKDRKEPSPTARNLIADIAAAYLPDDPAGALYTIDKVAGTPEAKLLCAIDAFQQTHF